MNDLAHILIRPHITEKAAHSGESSVYVFVVHPKATKQEIAKVFIEKYKVAPVRISTTIVPPKSVSVRGKRGKRSGYKKAYVYLKKGTKIENI